MDLQYSELDPNIRMIKLIGRLDITGTNQIESTFVSYCEGEAVRVVVDLSGVDFLASIGLRLLMLTARSITSRNGKVVLLNPTADVFHVLEVTGIPAILPVCSDFDSAAALLTGA